MSDQSGTERPVADLYPTTTPEAQPFWDALSAGELRLQRCPDTGRLIFPPTPTSPFGRHRAPEWVAVSGRGRIWSFVVPHPPLMRQFADAAPYVSVLVELDEDPSVRLPGPLVAASGAPLGSVPASQVAIGQAVEIDIPNPSGGNVSAPRWILCGDPARRT
jgi:uncharacterized OB-fold protein